MKLRFLICTISAAFMASVVPPTGGAASFAAGYDPDWSPDGRQLVYVRSDEDESADLWLMDANGGHKRALLRTPEFESDPSWSPDGSRIAYSARGEEGRHLYVLELASGRVTQVTDDPGRDYEPDWSPDGTQLVFSRYNADEERSQLFLSNADGSGERRLVVDDGDDVTPRWSPDGRFVAFVGGPDDEGYIELVEVATFAHRRITNGGYEYTPAWLPDGRIVFSSEAEGEDDDDLWVIAADGSGRQRLLGFRESDEWSPAPSPDGRWFAYVSDRDDTAQVFVARADGSASRRVTGVRYVESSSGARCTIWGTPGADVLRGTSSSDVICGLGGNDVILALAGSDTLDGGAGNDRLVGGAQTDSFYGGAGDDLLVSRDTRRESLDGGAGYDRADADPGDWVTFVEAWL